MPTPIKPIDTHKLLIISLWLNPFVKSFVNKVDNEANNKIPPDEYGIILGSMEQTNAELKFQLFGIY